MPNALCRPDALQSVQPVCRRGTAAPRRFQHSGTGAGIAAVALLLAGLASGPRAQAAEEPDAATLYGLHCAGCHGADGRPVLPGAPDFRRPDTLARPNGVLIRAIRDGKGAMPAYYGVLSDAQMRQIVNHLRRFH